MVGSTTEAGWNIISTYYECNFRFGCWEHMAPMKLTHSDKDMAFEVILHGYAPTHEKSGMLKMFNTIGSLKTNINHIFGAYFGR